MNYITYVDSAHLNNESQGKQQTILFACVVDISDEAGASRSLPLDIVAYINLDLCQLPTLHHVNAFECCVGVSQYVC